MTEKKQHNPLSMATTSMLLQKIPQGRYLVVFDGNCVLCSSLVRKLIKMDRDSKLIFTTFGSPLLLKDSSNYAFGQSLVLVSHHGIFTGPAAVLEISRLFRAFFILTVIIRILPSSWTEALYRLVAVSRYRIFGRKQHCSLPEDDQEGRYLR